MKYIISWLLLLSTSLLYGQSKTEKKIAQLVEQLKEAMVNADSVTLDKLTDAELSYGHSSGQLDSKASFIRKLASGQSDFVSIDLTGQTITISGKTAIVRHRLDASTNDSAKPGEVHLHVLLVWRKKGGNWKLLGRQAVKLP